MSEYKVEISSDAVIQVGVPTEGHGVTGPRGEQGYSAYQIAQQKGFTGTEEEWLDSLKGSPGEKGEQGPKGDDGTPGEKGADGANGADGKAGADGYSAYELAVQQGFNGNVDAWLESLKGPKGDDGAPGEKGANGVNGVAGKDGASAYDLAVKHGYNGTEEEWVNKWVRGTIVNSEIDTDGNLVLTDINNNKTKVPILDSVNAALAASNLPALEKSARDSAAAANSSATAAANSDQSATSAVNVVESLQKQVENSANLANSSATAATSAKLAGDNATAATNSAKKAGDSAAAATASEKNANASAAAAAASEKNANASATAAADTAKQINQNITTAENFAKSANEAASLATEKATDALNYCVASDNSAKAAEASASSAAASATNAETSAAAAREAAKSATGIDVTELVHIAGDETITGKKTFTGGVVGNNFQTGTAESGYFQCKKFRGEGNADNYYHAVDFGYQGHNQIDFYESSGLYRFNKCTSGKAADATLCGYINPNGWNGNVVGNLTGNVTGLASRATADADGNVISNSYALKSSLPTKTSQLENDSGFLTEHQSLAEYANLKDDNEFEKSVLIGGSLIIGGGSSTGLTPIILHDDDGTGSLSSATYTGNALTATRATQDSDGNPINSTYAKKSCRR